MEILNLTQHIASIEQKAAGVIEPDAATKRIIASLLTFDHLPSAVGVQERAAQLAVLVRGYDHGEWAHAMIGGALWLMGPLEKALRHVGVTPLYAFSERVVIEAGNEKTSRFVHRGFIEAVE